MPNKPQGKGSAVPRELEGAATTKDVSVLESRVDKCYSSERYEDFQGAVEKIVVRHLKSTVGWIGLLWVVSLVASVVAEKFLHLF